MPCAKRHAYDHAQVGDHVPQDTYILNIFIKNKLFGI